MNASILLLTLALSAGGNGNAKPKPAGEPKCTDQCDQMKQMCAQNCQMPAGKKFQGKNPCTSMCEEMTNACAGSCKEKGRLDEDYMTKHMKMPGAKSGAAAEDTSDHSEDAPPAASPASGE